MGYIRQSRSVNSMNAIEDYEVPMSMISKSLIDDLKTEEDVSSYDIDDKVFDLPVNIWKFGADKTGASSWHHTGKYFNCTLHYNLYEVAEYLTTEYNGIRRQFKAYRDSLKQDKEESLKSLKLGYIAYAVWGGSRRHPRIVDHESTYGYIDDSGKKDWLINQRGERFDIHANKVEELIEDSDLKSFKRAVEKKGLKVDLRRFKKFLRDKGLNVN